MTAYLDNNVYIDIENGRYKEIDFTSKSAMTFFYSESLIEELYEGEHLDKSNTQERISLITRLCGDNYILPGIGDKKPETIKQKPQQTYFIIGNSSLRLLRNALKDAVSQMSPNQEEFLKMLSSKRTEVNNIAPTEILSKINNAMSEYVHNGLKGFLMATEANGRSTYSTLFNLLDAVCYWKDMPNTQVARLHDSSHAYFSQICDYFVTNDKRLRYKAKAVYSYLGVKTTVISPNDFLKL